MSLIPESAQLHFSTLSSTHSWMKKNLGSLSKSPCICVRADVQTQGHGQFKRKWISPPGGIWASICLELHQTYQVNHLAMVLASSIISVLVVRGVYPKLKWPNDLLLNGSKFGGVLVEICQRQEQQVVICSYGINVNIDQKELADVDQKATSLAIATEEEWPLELLYKEINDQFERDFKLFEKTGYASFALWEQEWKS